MRHPLLAGVTRPGNTPFANPMAHSPFGLTSRARLQVVKPDGTVRGDTGWVDNVLTTFGLASLASMVGSSAGVNASTLVSAMKIGTGTTAATSNDTALVASTASVVITAASLTKTNLGARTVEYQATYASNNPAGAAVINEISLHANSTADSQAVNRIVLGTSSVNKLASDTINASVDLIFTTA